MARLGGLWSALEPRQRLVAVLAVAAVLATLYFLVRAAQTPAMATLYAGLDPATAGEVAAAVEGLGVPVEVRGNAVLVPAGDRDRMRLALAAEGLPRQGPRGYELLDGVDGFGTTSEMFEASYWRAKEGELARTILSAPGVREARVHIANPIGRPFQRASQPTASVTVTTSGGPLPPEMAEAIRYMVASAVPGMAPGSVSVIDAAYGAVLRQGEDAPSVSGVAGEARAAALRAEVERLLAARVGEGKAIVTVAVDATTETETVSERVIDPSSRIAISTDTREVTENAEGGVGGAATVASNLPQAGGGAEQQATRARSETEERVNFEISETRRERVKPAGDVKRLTVAVLVDGVTRYAEDGTRSWEPRSEEELDQLRELVQAAVGFDAERGDVVTVEMLEFAERPTVGAVASAGLTDMLAVNAVALMQMAVLAAVALGLALFVLRPLMKAAEAQAAPEPATPALIDYAEQSRARPEPVEEEPDRIEMLKDTFAERRDDSASVLRAWLERDVQETAESEGEKA